VDVVREAAETDAHAAASEARRRRSAVSSAQGCAR
jgi:hypothetical protein